MNVTIYHNPKCSKSRLTLQMLEDKGIKPTIVEYLKTPPNELQINNFLQHLGMQPRDLMRKGESEYKELNLADDTLSDTHLVEAMHNNPKLIERPIVVVENIAVENKQKTQVAIGRPIENVEKILK